MMMYFESGNMAHPSGRAVFYWNIDCRKDKSQCPLWLEKKNNLKYLPKFSLFVTEWCDGEYKKNGPSSVKIGDEQAESFFVKFRYFLFSSKEKLDIAIETAKSKWVDVDVIFAGNLRDCRCKNPGDYAQNIFRMYAMLYRSSRQAMPKIEAIFKELNENKSILHQMREIDKISALEGLTMRMIFEDLDELERESIEVKMKDIFSVLPDKYPRKGFLDAASLKNLSYNAIKNLEAISLYFSMYKAIHNQDFLRAAECKRELDDLLKN